MPSVIRGSDLFDTNTAIGFSTNHNAATGTITIPSGLEIGTRRLIRKIHPTQGTVTIDCTGETFTRAGLASVELNADGDYWLLEKVTATRWELVDGWNTGENANGNWVREASGKQDCCRRAFVQFTNSLTVSYPIAFSSIESIQNTGYNTSQYSGDVALNGNTSITTPSLTQVSIRNNSTTIGNDVFIKATGRWYL